MLFGITLAVGMAALFGGWKCCYQEFLFDSLILEEEGEVIEEILRTSAKEKLTEGVKNRIRAGQWTKSYFVAKDLIKNAATPTISEQ